MNIPLSNERVRQFRSALGAALAFVPSIGGAQGAGAPLAVWAIGLPDGYVIMEHQRASITITDADVARGMVEVRGGSRIRVTGSSPAHHTVQVLNRSALFQAVHVEGLDREPTLGLDGISVAHEAAAVGHRVFTIDYRFTLAPGTAPGTFAWPIEVVVRGATSTQSTDIRMPRF